MDKNKTSNERLVVFVVFKITCLTITVVCGFTNLVI